MTKSVAEELAALRLLKTAELAERYVALWNKPPHTRHREFMIKRILWKEQERKLGGLSGVAQRRLEELIAEIDLPQAEALRTVTGRLKKQSGTKLKPGTVLVRCWRGVELRAVITDEGVEVDGVTHRSLSAAARAITGSKWNGNLFWGITQRRRAN